MVKIKIIFKCIFFSEEESLEEQEQRVTEGLANFSIQRNPEKPIFAADFQQPQESSQIKKTFTSDILPLKIRIRLGTFLSEDLMYCKCVYVVDFRYTSTC